MQAEEEADPEETGSDQFDPDSVAPEGVEEGNFEREDMEQEETKQKNKEKVEEKEPDEEESKRSTSESPPDLLKDSGVDSGVFTASSEGETKSIEIPPVLTQVAPVTQGKQKTTIVNKLAEKLSALEEKVDSEKQTATKTDEKKSVQTSVENETKTETETKDSNKESNKTEKDSSLFESETKDEERNESKESEILEEIMVKAREHEDKPQEKDKPETPVKPNPFLSKLVESCKEKLGISEVRNIVQLFFWNKTPFMLDRYSTYPCKALMKIKVAIWKHQFTWGQDVWFDDLQIQKNVVIHDTMCPCWNRVSLNNTIKLRLKCDGGGSFNTNP